MTIVASLVALVALSSLAVAEETYPLLSAARVSIASGAHYEWRTTPFAPSSESLKGRHGEWAAGVFAAYNLTPHASLIGSTVLGIDSKQFRHTLGVRIRLWNGDKK